MRYEGVIILIADGNPDSNGNALDIEGVSWPADGVPVTYGIEEGAPIVGKATLRRNGSGFEVLADLDLDEDEIPLLETASLDALVPAIAGEGNPERFDLKVTSIGIGAWQNSDERIGALRPPPEPEPLTDEEGNLLLKRDPVPDGCEECPGCPDCLTGEE
jgi:hypothetical protein